MSKIAIVHTTAVTIDPLKKIIKKYLPESEIINFVDDSILPQLKENGSNLGEIEERYFHYMKYAEEVGVDIILNACSSVGELVSKAQNKINIPIVRIDNAMADIALQKGSTIGIVATISTTLLPTETMLKRKAEKNNKDIIFKSIIADQAYQLLISGDQKGHDRELAKVLTTIAKEVDIVVLAQASMARVMETLPLNLQDKFLTSPESGVKELIQILESDNR